MSKLIPEDYIRDLIARTNIIDIVSKHVALKKQGANYFGCCPFHNEKSPSFSVNEKKQFFYCFGCGASGTVIEFIKRIGHLTFPEAIEELASIHGIDVPYSSSYSKQQSAETRNLRTKLYDITEKTAQFYQQTLQSPAAQKAREYLSKRGLTAETINRFSLGYAPDEWDKTINTVARSKELQSAYQQAGLSVISRKQSQLDRFRDRIMFPIRDRQGKYVAFGGRIIENGDPKYLNSPETPIFHKGRLLYGLYEALEKNASPDLLLVVEGYMDVVSLSQYGIDYAVASLGTATTVEQLQLMFRFTSKVVCCYDGDKAGRHAAWRTLTTVLPLLTDDKQIDFLFLPESEDPDSFVQKHGKVKFEEQFKQAQSLSAFFFDTLVKQVDLTTQEGKSKLSAMAVPLLKQVTAQTTLLYLKEQLAYKLNLMNMAEFNALFNQQTTSKTSYQPIELKLTTMRILIGLLIQYPQLACHIDEPDALAITDLAGILLFINLVKFCHSSPGLNTAQILEHYRESEFEKQLEILACWNHMYDEDKVEAIFLQTVSELYDHILSQRFDTLVAKERSEGLTNDEKQEVHTIALSKAKNKQAKQSL